jgi:hypothetical protein
MTPMTRNISESAFALQFDQGKLPVLIERYRSAEDNPALKAGADIRAGSTYLRESVEAIFMWKTKGRGISRLRKNSDGEITDALTLATAAKTERAAVSVLCGLQGVDVPVASAILTAIDPERYTVIDFRALEALGNKSNDRTVNFYLAYLDACRQLAQEHQVSLRDLDRALWQWSSEQTKRK